MYFELYILSFSDKTGYINTNSNFIYLKIIKMVNFTHILLLQTHFNIGRIKNVELKMLQ